jgi:hypothetical protein
MFNIFDDERRGHGPIAPDPLADGTLFGRGGVAVGLCGPATPRLPLLTPAKNRSRHGGAIIVRRP